MNYYIEKDNKIIFVDTDLAILQNTIIGQDLEIKQTERPIINFEFADTPEYLAQKAEEEQRTQAYKNITKRQLLIWLFVNKQKTEADIFNAINSIQDPSQKYLATVNYTGTNNFYFGNAFTPVIGGALGLSLVELKKMFDEAGAL